MSLSEHPAETDRNGHTLERDPKPGEVAFDSLPEEEKRRRSYVAAFLAVEHSLEAVETIRELRRDIRELATASRLERESNALLANRVDCMITDMRELQRTTKTDPPGRSKLDSFMDLEKTDGGTRVYATPEQFDTLVAKKVSDALAAADAKHNEEMVKRISGVRWAAVTTLVGAALLAAATACGHGIAWLWHVLVK